MISRRLDPYASTMVKIILAILIGICVVGVGLSLAQPPIPKSIPSDIPSDVRAQIERLYSSDPVERGYGAHELGEMGTRAVPAIPYLVQIIEDNSSLQWNPEGGYTSPGVEAVRALGKIGGPAIEPLIATLKNTDVYVRREAAETLGKSKDSRAVEPLVATLKDKDEDWAVRRKAAEALGKIKDSRAVEPLIDAFRDERVEREATFSLAEIGKPAVEPLIATLKDGDSHVRQNAAEALGRIKDTSAVEPLIAALKQDYLRASAAWALWMITGEDFGEDSKKWQEWWEKNKVKARNEK
ncbi:MAG TPA: HEAT repeat domain-containing protein [Candidatus Hypogeohydataceae bacterium YC41]